uniref:Uncharacterized protein n=1 Tax=Myoviridae sp. ctuJM17 TaxID=2825200 RepID=A0A8S5PII3_9CAUD|nr:MAG TPA: hypothetical protein [Myoviridae sp. ctuJM17]
MSLQTQNRPEKAQKRRPESRPIVTHTKTPL